jgi:tetratricopeptide (TPR) repeat protein
MSETSNDEGREPTQSAARAQTPDPASAEILQLLLAEIESDPGAAVFPNLAEAYRRVGQAERALEIASRGLDGAPERMAGRVALGLALLDVDEADQAREVLSAIFEDVPQLMALLQPGDLQPEEAQPEEVQEEIREAAGPEPLRDDEISLAIDGAEARPDEMIDVNDVAAAALREERLDEPEVGFAPSDHPAFATATMANLLENQGDIQNAESIRSTLADDPLSVVAEELGAEEFVTEGIAADEVPMDAAKAPEPEADPFERKTRIIAALEGWLDNIRRDVA